MKEKGEKKKGRKLQQKRGRRVRSFKNAIISYNILHLPYLGYRGSSYTLRFIYVAYYENGSNALSVQEE